MNKKFTQSILWIFIVSITLLSSCKKENKEAAVPETSCFPDIAFTSIDDDLTLGRQVDSQIVATPSEFPILSKTQFPKAYEHLNRITNNIKKSGKVGNADKLVWEIKIIHKDDVLNAFCTPGGYIYVYTGIIKYLDTEDDFAGVMGHEIAHADLRHSAKGMIQEYGLQSLLAIIAGQGEPGLLAQIASGLAGLSSLKYSRCHETQADENSVSYLSNTNYKCNGAASFFEKIVEAGGSGTPVFMSTHPDPGNRVANINAKAVKLGCNTSTAFPDAQYQDFKNSLPR